MTVARLTGLVLAWVASGTAHAQTEARPRESVPEYWAYLNQNRTDLTGLDQLHAGKRLWPAGDTIKICFFSGNPVVNNLIATVASEWQQYANLRLDFGQPGAWRDCLNSQSGFSQIRIGFGQKDFFSAIGTDSIVLANVLQPSMNFQNFNLKYQPNQLSPSGVIYTPQNVVAQSKEWDRGTILHEFGHALGLLHEHQNPRLGCQDEIRWTGPNNVYDFYASPPNEWDRAKVDLNLGPISRPYPDAQAGTPDRESIMIYAQPEEIFVNGRNSVCFVEEKNRLSPLDKALIARLYPAGATPPSDTQFSAVSAFGQSAAANLAGPVPTKDRLARIQADLNSDVVSARREARRQLALELERTSSDQLSQIIRSVAASNNYRQQLGLVVALDKAPSTPPLNSMQSSMIRGDLNSIASTNDATLKAATTRAIERLGVGCPTTTQMC